MLQEAMRDVATKADIKDAVHSMTVRFGAMLGATTALTIAGVGVLISVN